MRSNPRLRLLFITIMLMIAVTSAAQETTETPENTAEPGSQVLRVWWPATLRSPENPQALDTLNLQTASFVASEENIEVETRIKTVGDVGSVISTMRRANPVAPDALPTLALVNRQDLLIAQAEGLAESLDGMFQPTIQDDMGNAIRLGQIDGELYGIPYMLDLQHLVYRPQDDDTYDSWSYDAVLARDTPFVFPAAGTNGLSAVLLAQYLNAGGTILPESGLSLSRTALETMMGFYEAANDAELIDGFALNYTSPSDYINSFQTGDIDIAVFSSSTYLLLHEQEPTLELAPLPTEEGDPASVMNGWMWVLVSDEPQEQTLALRYLNWMMNPERQAEYARTVYMVPSQSSALQRGLAGNADVAIHEALIANATIPISEAQGGRLARNIQQAVASILTRERNAEQATQFVIDQQT